MTRKAYRIITTQHNPGDWGVYSAESAGRAKTMCLVGLWDAYRDANYSWITSCRRAPEFDTQAEKIGGCLAWKDGREQWHIEKGHTRGEAT